MPPSGQIILATNDWRMEPARIPGRQVIQPRAMTQDLVQRFTARCLQHRGQICPPVNKLQDAGAHLHPGCDDLRFSPRSGLCGRLAARFRHMPDSLHYWILIRTLYTCWRGSPEWVPKVPSSILTSSVLTPTDVGLPLITPDRESSESPSGNGPSCKYHR